MEIDDPVFWSCCSILEHTGGVLSRRVVKKLKYLTTLVTLSERIGSSLYVPWRGSGEYSCELESLQSRVRGRRRRTTVQQQRKADLVSSCVLCS